MDREALVLRNRRMAEAFHATPVKHHVRRAMLYSLARLPISPGKAVTEPSTGENPRILLIRPDHLGDVLLTTPAIHALRKALPHAEIHALVGPWSANVLARLPDLDYILTLAFPGFKRSTDRDWLFPYKLAVQSARQLRQVGYHSAVILRPDHWWGAMLAYLAGIPERIGYDLPDTAPFLTDAVPHQHQHAVVQSLGLVERWTGPIAHEDIHYHYAIDKADRAYVDGYLSEWGIEPDEPVFCIHPGSGTWVKRWENARWTTVADTLIEQLDAAVVLTGSDHELPLVQEITARMHHPACIMVGDTQVGQLAALFARACVVLGPDSGPLHLAAAVGAPTVALFGPADPVEFSPWGSPEKHIVLASDIGCRPCRVLDWRDDNPEFHPCVREITVGRVLEAARRVAAE